MIESAKSGSGRIASLDMLRGIAAFAVAIPHYFILIGLHADTAEVVSVLSVELFFPLSGFVLAPQIIACARSGRFADLRVFLIRRWMRTILPYLVPLLALSLLYGKLFSPDFFRYLFYVQNLFAQYNAQDYYPVAWSLSIEEWFYLLFPALVMAIGRLGSFQGTRFLATVALGYIVVVSALRIAFGDAADWGGEVRRVVVFREDSIAYGFLLYLVISQPRVRQAAAKRLNRGVAATAIFFVVAASFAAASITAIGIGHGRLAELTFPFAAAAFGCSAVLLCYRLAPVVDRSPTVRRLALFAGRISYSVYLLHLLVALLLRRQLVALPVWLQLVVYVGTLVAVAAIFYRFYEKSILAARPKYPRVKTLQVVENSPQHSETMA